MMFTRISGCLVIIFALFIGFHCNANSLTNRQINILLENDDTQIFTSPLTVKKVSLTIEQSSDNSQGKTIVEYDKSGLLANYYSTSVVDDELQEQTSIITTLLQIEPNKWQRKQTMGDYEIDDSIYTLKNGQVNITILPTLGYDKKRVIEQKTLESNEKGDKILLSYAEPLEKEQLEIEYQFDKDGNLASFNFLEIDESEYGYISKVRSHFEYDEQQRLVKGNEDSYYQFINESGEKNESTLTYSDFDKHGNWQTKVEKFGDDKLVYKRVIEYWD